MNLKRKSKLVYPFSRKRCRRNCALAMLLEHNTEEWICSLSAITKTYTISPTASTEQFRPQVSAVMCDA